MTFFTAMIRSLLFLLLVLSLWSCDNVPKSETDGKEQESSAKGQLSIRFEGHVVTVDPAAGGRLGSYVLNGQEILQTTRDEEGLQWGSTAWTSPQSAWNWPPEKTFDSGAFEVIKHTADAISLRSAIDPATSLQMEKTFAFIDQPKGMYLETIYRLINHGTETISRGLWENTRLPYGGEFYFSADSLRLDKLTNNFSKRGKSTIVPMRPGDVQKGKVFVHPAKGRGTYAGNGFRFRKLWFSGEGAVAPGHAPLELYLSPKDGFAEFEIQGVYRVIPPGESNSLTVAWKVGKLEKTD